MKKIDAKSDIHGKILMRRVNGAVVGRLFHHFAVGVVENSKEWAIQVSGTIFDKMKKGSIRVAKVELKNRAQWKILELGLPSTGSPDEIVAQATRFVGKVFDYDLLFNNCQHFATFCVYGYGLSSEALRWLKRWKKLSVVTRWRLGLDSLMRKATILVEPRAGPESRSVKPRDRAQPYVCIYYMEEETMIQQKLPMTTLSTPDERAMHSRTHKCDEQV
jgi:hypothetical protein